MRSAEQMRSYAQNCLELAAEAKSESERRRFERLADGWAEMAETQEWLDGTALPKVREEGTEGFRVR